MVLMNFHFQPSNDAGFDVCSDPPPVPAKPAAPRGTAPSAVPAQHAPRHPPRPAETAKG